MGGPGDPRDPPEGTPEGGSSGAEDEYRSVVFDESFVRAARLQEYSAQERMTDHAPAVRRRPHQRLRGQLLILALLIAVAFGTALYLGVRQPYGGPQTRRPVEPLRMTIIPLAPRGKVPGATGTTGAKNLFAHSPAAHFEVGAEGIPLPATRSTPHFSESQVWAALTAAKDYLVHSSLYPEVITGRQVHPVRSLLDPDQLDQFDRSFSHPAADGAHAPTGWLVRLDPARAELADDGIRVQGSLTAAETDAGALEVTTDHTFVYALRPAHAASGAPVSLFTVRRELTFRVDRDDLRTHQVELITSYTEAGPLPCGEDSAAYLRPVLAGRTAGPGAPAGTNPYDPDATTATALCGTLATPAPPTA